VKTYVVGTDGSETAARAAKRAGDLATQTGATVHVVCAYDRRGASTVGGVGGDSFEISSLQSAEQIADQQAATFRARGIDATSAALDEKPAEALLSEAERLEAEMIIVGNRRMHGVSRILGAVANHVAHNAPCDVLVVKTV
jgi:nucleotide-binding universal stress UspA family protein